MTNDQKDAICQLWIEIFGTQEGVGYNCPQGAYDFATVVMGYKQDRITDALMEMHKQANGDHNYYHYAVNKIKELE